MSGLDPTVRFARWGHIGDGAYAAKGIGMRRFCITCVLAIVAIAETTASAQTLQRQTSAPTRSARIALPTLPPARKASALSVPRLTMIGRQLTGNPQAQASPVTMHFEMNATASDPIVFLFRPFMTTTDSSTVMMSNDSAAGFRLRKVGMPPITGSALFVCSVKSDRPLTWSAFAADDSAMIHGPVQQTDEGAVFTVDLAQIDPLMPVRLQSDAGSWQFWSCDATILT